MRKRLKAFVSAPIQADFSLIERILISKGVEVYDPHGVRFGSPVPDVVTRTIRKVDFTVIVVTGIYANTFFEIGICEALKIPTLLILDRNTETPTFLEKYVHLETDFKDEELLSIALSQFVNDVAKTRDKKLSKVSRGVAHSFPRDTGASLSPSKVDLLNESKRALAAYQNTIRDLRTSGDHAEIASLTERIFSSDLQLSSRLQVESNRFVSQDGRIRYPEVGADFAVWSDKLSSSIGNPILIELKSGVLSKQVIEDAEDRLKDYIAKSDAKAGLLLYLDRSGQRFDQGESIAPLIIRYDLEDFVGDLSRSEFDRVILRQRNKMIHGNF